MKLLIPEPCSQKWESMFDLTDESKFCGVCTKQIVDFTRYSDRKLIQTIQRNPGNICGKFSKTQLNRSLFESRFHFPSLKSILLAGTLLPLSMEYNAQENQNRIEKIDSQTNGQYLTVIKGHFKDTLMQIQGEVKIELVEYKLFCYPNEDGFFQFNVPSENRLSTVKLIVRKGNAYKVYSDLNPNEFIEISVSLHPIYIDKNLINTLPMIGLVVVKPKWYQFGYKFRRLWYRLVG